MLERQISLPDIVRSTEPSVLKLRQDDYPQLFSFVTACATNYLGYCFPQQTAIAPNFANDLIETRPTWKLADFVAMFKFFRQRQDLPELKVFGNTITGVRLMEMVTVYEEHRAREFEQLQAEKRGEYVAANRVANPLVQRLALKMKGEGFAPTGDKVLGAQSERVNAEQERRRMNGEINERSVAPDETYFKREHGV